MKYQSLSSFEGHLAKQAGHELSHVYLFVAKDRFDRTSAITHLKKLMLHQFPQIELHSYQVDEVPLKEVAQEIQNPSLFASDKLLIVEGIEALNSQDFNLLHELIVSLPSSIRLILSGTDIKSSPKFYEKLKTHLVMLDLRGEKPWTQRQRIEASLIKRARDAKKTLVMDAMQALIDHVGLHLAELDSHLEKLICFTGEKPRIERVDVEAFIYSALPFNGWKLVDAMLFHTEPPRAINQVNDPSQLIPFLGQLRHRIYNALLMHQSVREKRNLLTKMPPQMIDKFRPLALRFSPKYYELALKELFDLELKMRQDQLKPQDLLTRLQAELYDRAKTYSFTQSPYA
ncbi:MAG: hypothetical protein MRY21_08225 [Simkaniaceae bacterium]|nr:hypothetical protein [Simkaniaceae bacterium]